MNENIEDTSAHVPISILEQFTQALHAFLQSLARSFPKCPHTKNYLYEFETLVLPFEPLQQKIIERWHETMKDHYELCAQKKSEVFLSDQVKIEMLTKLNFKSKWDRMQSSPASVAALWAAIQNLNSLASMHALPTTLIQKIETKLSTVFSGGGDLSLLDLQEFGNSILEGATDDDISNLLDNLPNLIAANANGAEEMAKSGLPNIPNLKSLLGDLGHLLPSKQKQREAPPPKQTLQQAMKGGWRPS